MAPRPLPIGNYALMVTQRLGLGRRFARILGGRVCPMTRLCRVIDRSTSWADSSEMQSKAARWAIASTAIGLSATVAALAAPRFAEAIEPSFLDSVVPVGMVVAAVVLLARHEWLTAHLFAWTATLWSLTGVAGLLGGPLETFLPRLALVPHALVIGGLLALPYGDLVGRRRVLALAAVVVAVAAGAGVTIPALLLFGVLLVAACLVGTRRAGAPEAIATSIVQLVIGAGWASLWMLDPRLDVHTVADGVALLLLASAVAVVLILGRGEVATELGTEVGRRVGAVLGRPSVDVLFPVADDPSVALNVEGRRLPLPPATPVAAEHRWWPGSPHRSLLVRGPSVPWRPSCGHWPRWLPLMTAGAGRLSCSTSRAADSRPRRTTSGSASRDR